LWSPGRRWLEDVECRRTESGRDRQTPRGYGVRSREERGKRREEKKLEGEWRRDALMGLDLIYLELFNNNNCGGSFSFWMLDRWPSHPGQIEMKMGMKMKMGLTIVSDMSWAVIVLLLLAGWLLRRYMRGLFLVRIAKRRAFPREVA